MITLLLSIVFITSILAAPAPAQNQFLLQWSKLKEDKSLGRFQATLLNDKFLPFLNECYTDQVAQSNRESKTRESICSRYFDAILQLNSTNYTVDASTVLKLLAESNTTVPFCDKKHIFPVQKFFPNATRRDFNNPAVCGQSCLEDDAITPKPICILLAWMGDEIMKIPTGKIEHHIEKVLPVVTTTIAPTNVNVSLNKASDSIKLQEKPLNNIKTDQIVEKPALHSTKNPKIPVLSNNSVEPPIKTEDKQPEKKEPEVVPIKQKEEKKTAQPLEEDKDYVTSPTLNSSVHDPIQQAESPKINPEKADYENPDTDEESNGDETVVGNEDLGQTNEKSSNIGIVNPENEQNHSSSQEIIDNNVIPTTATNSLKDPFHEQSGSNFFTYFLVGMFLCIAMYVFYHNKSKILALLLEGRRGDKGRSGRRKHTAAYRKLDSNLEEAITSSARGRTTQIIY